MMHMGNVFLSFFFFFFKTTDHDAFLSETVQNMACTLVCYERKTTFFGGN